jgi:tubulin---tyrosine ligase
MANYHPIQVLIGMDEDYTKNKIIDSFRFRNNYQVTVLSLNKDDNEIREKHFDFYWLEYEDLNFEKLIHSSKVFINSFCIRKGLIRKAQLAYNIQKYIRKKPDSCLVKYVPETFIFEIDYLDYFDEAMSDIYEVDIDLAKNLKVLSLVLL